MTDHQSDAELHMERLVQLALDPNPRARDGLSLYDCFEIYLARKAMADLMLSLAVRLGAGHAPGT